MLAPSYLSFFVLLFMFILLAGKYENNSEIKKEHKREALSMDNRGLRSFHRQHINYG